MKAPFLRLLAVGIIAAGLLSPLVAQAQGVVEGTGPLRSPGVPLVPTGVSASKGTYSDKVRVSWNASAGANYYNVLRNTSNSTSGGLWLPAVTAPPLDDTYFLTLGEQYWYFVQACDTSCSSFSASDSGYLLIPPPTGLTASDGIWADDVEIRWDPLQGIITYEVYRNASSGPGGTFLNSTSAPGYFDFAVVPGHMYWYSVKACGDASCSAYSNVNSGFRQLQEPTNVSASDGTYADKVQVSWAAASGADYHELYRNTTNSFTGSDLMGYASSPYNDTAALPGTVYWYFVRACGTAGCSRVGLPDTGYRNLDAPGGVAASDGAYADKVEVSWTGVSGAAYYLLYRNSKDAFGSATLFGASNASPYEDASTSPDVPTWYFVRACNAGMCGSPSVSDQGYSAGPPDLSLSFKSSGAQDGWIREAGEGLGTGKAINAVATTFSLGDDLLRRQYRSILSFNTAALPDSAVITSVTLKFRRTAQVGDNPFTALGEIVADIKSGSFGSATLQAADFNAPADAEVVVSFPDTPDVNGWYSGTLGNGNFIYINPMGVTQFRLRFASPHDADDLADMLKFASGNSTAANRPQLIITYYVP